MKKLIYKLIYQPQVNFLLRNLALPVARKFKKPMPLAVSGRLNLEFNGIRFHLHTNQTSAVTQQLFYHGAKNYEFAPLFALLISKSEVFFDVGANIGFFSVLGEKLNPGMKTFSFEPSHGSLHYLKKNIQSNSIKKSTVINKALADIDGELTFYDVINPKYPWLVHQLNGSNSLQNRYGAVKQRSYAVSTTTLEAVVRKNDIQRLDLLKLDTECTEHQILQSGIEVIRKFRPFIICEVYDVIARDVQLILSVLEDYAIFQYKNRKLIPVSDLEKVTGENDRNFFFCPQEKLYPDLRSLLQ